MSAWLEHTLVFSVSCAVSLALIRYGGYLERKFARVSDDEKALRDLLAWVSVSDSRICKFWVETDDGTHVVEAWDGKVRSSKIGPTFAAAASATLKRAEDIET